MYFGAFVEIEPGIEGLIHISEMAWGKKSASSQRHPQAGRHGGCSDPVSEAGGEAHRTGAQADLDRPVVECATAISYRLPGGRPDHQADEFWRICSTRRCIEGLIHVSEISATKRINHPSDVLRAGQVVKAQVLAIDVEKRQIKLSMKQLIPTSIDEYIAEHKVGDQVSGRVIELSATQVVVELGEGIRVTCGAAGTGRAGGAPAAPTIAPETDFAPKVDLSSLSSQLKDRWQGNTPAVQSKPEALTRVRFAPSKL